MHPHPKATGHFYEAEPGGSAQHIPNVPSGVIASPGLIQALDASQSQICYLQLQLELIEAADPNFLVKY